MIGKIPVSRGRLAAVAVALAALAINAAPASASVKVVYSNLNTVQPFVNSEPNEDTYSAAPFEFPFGGIVEFSHRPGVLKSMSAQVDSFTCEHGTYNSENCYTANPNKKFGYELTASIYEANEGDKEGALVATSTGRFKIPFRPTTNVACPETPEGKGFGANCDVGGYLATVKFKAFSPAGSVLPERAIIVITNTISDRKSQVVNVGMETSYKEWDEALGPGDEGFIAEGPADEGKPSVGSDPFPEDAFVHNELAEGGWAGYQPVLQVLAKP
jgi:hypothetical protein